MSSDWHETQAAWPFGPAPRKQCPQGGEHAWRIIDLFHAAEPPFPSFECEHCHYRWSRTWTQAEFRKFAAGDEYYLCVIDSYPLEPPYAS